MTEYGTSHEAGRKDSEDFSHTEIRMKNIWGDRNI